MCYIFTIKFSVVSSEICSQKALFKILSRHRTSVRLGEYDASTVDDCDRSDPEDVECADPIQDIAITSVVAHPGFRSKRLELNDDIALIRLAEAANFKQNNIKPICLPFERDIQRLPDKFLAIGWGYTQKNIQSAILQKAVLPLYDQETCRQKLTTKVRAAKLIEGQFCAGGEGKYTRDDESNLDECFSRTSRYVPRRFRFSASSARSCQRKAEDGAIWNCFLWCHYLRCRVSDAGDIHKSLQVSELDSGQHAIKYWILLANHKTVRVIFTTDTNRIRHEAEFTCQKALQSLLSIAQ